MREICGGLLPRLPVTAVRRVATGNRLRADESRCEGNELFGRHALLGQFVSCALVLLQMREAHATQDIGGLGELDIRVVNDLYAVASRVPEIEEGAIKQANTCCLERLAGRDLVVDDKTEMTAIVGWLFATLLERDELVAQIDEGHGVALAAQLEGKEAAVERERLFNVGNLERDVVETHQARFPKLSHWFLQSAIHLLGPVYMCNVMRQDSTELVLGAPAGSAMARRTQDG